MDPSAKPMNDYLSEISRLFPRTIQNESPSNLTMSSRQEFNWEPRPILANTHDESHKSTTENAESIQYKTQTTNSKLTQNIGRKIVGAKGCLTNTDVTNTLLTNSSPIPVYYNQNEYANRFTSTPPEYSSQRLFQDYNDYSVYRQSIFPVPNRGNDSAFAMLNSPPPSPKELCSFCRKNGETPLVYTTHAVRTKVDGKTIVTCPILRSLVCSMCGASGDNAHTLTYCPLLRSANQGMPIQSTTIALKNTRVKSNGRRRY